MGPLASSIYVTIARLFLLNAQRPYTFFVRLFRALFFRPAGFFGIAPRGCKTWRVCGNRRLQYQIVDGCRCIATMTNVVGFLLMYSYPCSYISFL
jgi:hypothetical protein